MGGKISWPLTLLSIGFGVALIGELFGAARKERGDTLSEWFRALPGWVKHLISWALGAVCAHLWEWQIGDEPTVEVQGDLNVENIEVKKGDGA